MVKSAGVEGSEVGGVFGVKGGLFGVESWGLGIFWGFWLGL